MSAILAQLGGNPFNTVVGQKIEQGTDASLASENWALNMEICDIINDTDEGPRDAVRAIRKRLQQNAGKNYTVVMYALTVLETCVKNCGRRFHLLITQKDFVQDLVKLIGPKNDPPTAVQEKVLSLIQSWADAFRNVSDMQGVVQVYNDLKQKGIEFPMTDLDTMAPIHTPQRTVLPHPPSMPTRPQEDVQLPPPSQQPPQQQQHHHRPSSGHHHHHQGPGQVVTPPPQSQGPIQLSPEQMAKLRSELDVVQGNMKVLGDMLSEMKPGQQHHASDLELLKDLYTTCRVMQGRLMELIEKVANEEVTNELLRINDELNNLFLRYERFEKNRVASMPNSAVTTTGPTTQPATQAAVKSPDAKPLIDLGDESNGDAVEAQLANLGLGGATANSTPGQVNTLTSSNRKPLEGSDEFDMFAQSRNATYEQSKTSGSTYADNTSGDQVASLRALAQVKGKSEESGDLYKLQKEQDFDEMERWLEEQTPRGQGPESITSSEFDRFLAERAAAVEQLPNVPASAIPTTTTTTTTTTTPQSSASPNRTTGANRRYMDKDESESTLFAL